VSAFSEHKDEAAEFVKFLTADEGNRIWYDAYGDIPATQELLGYIETAEETSEFPDNAYRLAVHEARNTAVPRPQTPGYLEFEDILSTTLEDIRNGADPEEALNAAVQRIDRGLERYEGV
jgi:multiple sugar transport system substrate-binding protein